MVHICLVQQMLHPPVTHTGKTDCAGARQAELLAASVFLPLLDADQLPRERKEEVRPPALRSVKRKPVELSKLGGTMFWQQRHIRTYLVCWRGSLPRSSAACWLARAPGMRPLCCCTSARPRCRGQARAALRSCRTSRRSWRRPWTRPTSRCGVPAGALLDARSGDVVNLR